MNATAARRGLVIGCGGTLGFAWSAVAVAEVERQLGWDARSAEVLVGTSAGSELVATLGSGRAASDVLAALDGEPDADPVLAAHVARHPGAVPPIPVPAMPRLKTVMLGVREKAPLTALAGIAPVGRGDATWLRDFGAALTNGRAWVAHPRTWLVAADADTGERIVFGSPGTPFIPIGTAIAASWAIPGWFPPVEVSGHRYLDGGAVSTASADVAMGLDLDEVVVIAPMTTHGGASASGLGLAERFLLRDRMTPVLDREVEMLEKAGTRVIRIEPGRRELDAMGVNFMNLKRRPATLAAARAALPATVARALA